MGEFGDYFKNWNWEAGFRYSRNEGQDLSVGEASQPGLREALLDTNPATAFNPFLGFRGHNTQAARSRVYVTLQNSGEDESPLAYFTINGELFNLPAGPVGFAVGGEYQGDRFTRIRDTLNATFQSIGSVDGQGFRVNRDIWGTYQEVRVPVTSPTWNVPGFYSLEIDFAEREEWYSNNSSTVLVPFIPSAHTRYNAQKPKVSVRWQPLDPKWIGGLTLRGSYSEAFHAPTLSELSPAGSQNFPIVSDPFSSQTETQVEERVSGNPLLKPETAYEWTYGIVYSPKWVPGLTLSADWWHIDLRSVVSALGAQFVISHNLPGLVTRGPTTIPGELGPVTLVIDPNENLAGTIFEGLDYEGIYIMESSIFGHGDFGRFTTTVNGTWLSRAELQTGPDSKPFGIAGEFLPSSFSLTSSLPRHRANASVFWDGPANTWMAGFDIGGVVHFTSQYNDDLISGFNRKVREWITADLIGSYTFNLPAPVAQQEVAGYSKDGGKNVRMKDGKDKNVMPVSTAEYNPCGWRAWLNGTTIQLGMQNITDEDPPFVGGSFENGYDESLTTIKGRFYYVGLKKRF
jgi:outer membrane receptor protein involved in Fe transport